MSQHELLHYLVDEYGNVIGDYKESNQPFGFLRERKPVVYENENDTAKQMMLELRDLFMYSNDTLYHNGYEYLEQGDYMIYRKVAQVTYYKELNYQRDAVPEGQFLYLTYKAENPQNPVELMDYYILTTTDRGLTQALEGHFRLNYGLDIERELVIPETSEEIEYWMSNTSQID